MLTEAEKKWLDERETYPNEREAPYFCAYCPKRGHVDSARDCLDYWSIDGNCPVESYDFRDAAEFSARVAAKLAETAGDIALLLKQAGLEQLSDWQLLRITRLAIEEEMQ